MANPLILSPRRRELMVQLGRDKRRQDRKDEAEVVITQAIKIFRHHLPEMLEESPCTDRFERLWPDIDAQLRRDLKTQHAYRFAYSVICQKLEMGNRQGVWCIAIPPPYLTVRRPHPFRSEHWHQATITMANATHTWRPTLSEPTQDPDLLFARFLVCGILYGGLNRPPLWLALGRALLEIQPLSGNRELAWLTLTLEPGDLPSNSYCRHDKHDGNAEHNEMNQTGLRAITQVNYMPDPISLGVLRQFLKHRPATWRPPTKQEECLGLLQKELGKEISPQALCRGAISLTEHQLGTELPQVLLEYAVGRTPSASLSLAYWHRLLEPRLFPATQDSYQRFLSTGSQVSRPTASGNRPSHKPYLLDELRAIFRQDPAAPKGPKAVITDLETLGKTSAFTLSEQVLVSWLQSLILIRRLAPSTAQRYLESIGKEWLSMTAQLPLSSYDGTDFAELYHSILNRPRSQYQRDYMAGRFQDMHAFAVQAFDITPLPEPLATGEKNIPHVSAAVVDEPLFASLLTQIDCFTDADFALRGMLKCFLIMAYRTGLRPGELAKLRLMDVEPSPVGWLFVRNNRHGHNKTDAALRKVPLYPMLTATENDLLKRYIGERRMRADSKSELLFHAAGNPHERVNIQQISLMAKSVLYQLSGGLHYRLYHLRHSCFSRMQLLLHHDLVPLPDFVQQALLPYPTTQREEIVRLVAGQGRLRDRYMALAVMAGHSSPEITLNNYLHFTDLLLGCHLARNQTTLSRQESQYLFGISTNKVHTLENGHEKQTPLTPARLTPYLLTKLGVYQAKPPRRGRQGIQAKTLADADRASHYVQSEAVLKYLEKGKEQREIANQFGLSEEQVATWHASAIELGNLITQKRRSRLIPRHRQRQLLPAELSTTAEKHAQADALKVCQTMRNKPRQMAEFRWAICYCLTNSNSSHAGIKFTDPKTFRRFMAFVSKLYPWSQWQLALYTPQDKPAKRWHLNPALAIERSILRKVQQFPQGYAYLYLRHPKEELRQEGHSSPLLRYLFHRFAIILFKAHIIRRWQIGESTVLQGVANLVDTEPMTYEVLMEINRMSRCMTRFEMALCGPLFQEALHKADGDVFSAVASTLYEEDRQRAAEWTAQEEPKWD
ncbi:site-specific integrase [Aeromonas media]|uniref:site-specific integrase n=1 Tax=Aeromonas media TaxID=651 RepID=UPI00227FEC16|nr:site-specific integrase [Aeromonas media]MCY9824117.1 site-specific integrase [Aeromonas media]